MAASIDLSPGFPIGPGGSPPCLYVVSGVVASATTLGVARIAGGREVVRGREEEALRRGAVDSELVEERAVGGRVEERAERAHLLLLKAAGHVEARPAFREGHLHAPRADAALEAREE